VCWRRRIKETNKGNAKEIPRKVVMREAVVHLAQNGFPRQNDVCNAFLLFLWEVGLSQDISNTGIESQTTDGAAFLGMS
jgi:hypothetical protein